MVFCLTFRAGLQSHLDHFRFDANGSAVIVHLNPDRGETGVTGASGGARIACGVIQLVPDDDDDFNIGR